MTILFTRESTFGGSQFTVDYPCASTFFTFQRTPRGVRDSLARFTAKGKTKEKQKQNPTGWTRRQCAHRVERREQTLSQINKDRSYEGTVCVGWVGGEVHSAERTYTERKEQNGDTQSRKEIQRAERRYRMEIHKKERTYK